jgi:hypothetical protein
VQSNATKSAALLPLFHYFLQAQNIASLKWLPMTYAPGLSKTAACAAYCMDCLNCKYGPPSYLWILTEVGVGPCPAESLTGPMEKIPHRGEGPIWHHAAERRAEFCCRDVKITGELGATVYFPEDSQRGKPLPALVHFHDGMFMLLDLYTGKDTLTQFRPCRGFCPLATSRSSNRFCKSTFRLIQRLYFER